MGHPALCCGESGGVKFLLSHLSRKNKNAAKAGHPVVAIV